LYDLKYEDIQGMEGFKDKSIKNILQELKNQKRYLSNKCCLP
jgi:NAD-dependent DNA ligase